MDKQKQYTITLNKHQLDTLKWATDAMSRIICGQLDFSMMKICEQAWIRDHKTDEHPNGIGSPEWRDMRKELKEHLQAICKLCWGQDYGIYYDDTADELYDMHCVIRKFKFDHIITDEERENKRWTVMADTPLHTSDQPLIVINELKTEEHGT